jgi:hypothetical protein
MLGLKKIVWRLIKMAKGEFKIGVWAFLVGLLLAVVLALVSVFQGQTTPTWAVVVLAVLGVLVGILNVTASEVQRFLVAMIAFLLSVSALGGVFQALGSSGIWVGLASFFQLMGVFMAPAAVVVAIQALYLLARD